MTMEEDIDRFLEEQKTAGRVYVRPVPQFAMPWLTKEYFQAVIRKCMGRNYIYLDEYDLVLDWLKDNQGKGLLLIGSNGVGKSVLTTKVIPFLFNRCYNYIFSIYMAIEMTNTSTYKEIMKKRLIVIDDIGTESKCDEFNFRRELFPDIIDTVEQDGKLFIGSTNLETNEITARYGLRTIDRLRAITLPIVIKHESMRGKPMANNAEQAEKPEASNADE